MDSLFHGRVAEETKRQIRSIMNSNKEVDQYQSCTSATAT